MKRRPVSGARRTFLARGSGLGTATLLGLPRFACAEPPPETTRIRLAHELAICLAPQYLAEELLRAEGFLQVEYVEREDRPSTIDMLAEGRIDLWMKSIPYLITSIDSGYPIVLLAGIHAGCYELFGNERIAAIRDLKGKKIAISAFGTSEHVFISSMLGYVGINPEREIEWVTAQTTSHAMHVFADGKADAFLGFPPEPQELRARKIGRVIVNTAQDRPWSQYFCCALTANKAFVRRHPQATKRALRAILKASDICADQPERVAQYMVAKGYEPRYDIALDTLKGLPFRMWRESNPEDTLRFHALRLHEVGMVKTAPQKLIAQGADWRFLNELKKELKA